MRFLMTTQTRFTTFTIGALLGLCSCQPTDSGDRSIDAGEASANCTLETPLKPGVPGSPGNMIPSAINPNGHSELAHLMRGMQADMDKIRERILGGQGAGAVSPSHRKIRCAWPTEESMRNKEFDLKAQSYQSAVDALERTKADHRGFYNAVISQCISCHNTSCPGPITAINKLLIPD